MKKISLNGFWDLDYISEVPYISEDEPTFWLDSNNSASITKFPVPAYWEDEDMDKTYPGLLLEMTSTYLGDVPVDVTNFCIVFDNSGEIFYITETENSYHYRAQNGRQHTGIYVTREDTMTWPEELLGDNVTAIRIYSIAYSDRTFPDLP